MVIKNTGSCSAKGEIYMTKEENHTRRTSRDSSICIEHGKIMD